MRILDDPPCLLPSAGRFRQMQVDSEKFGEIRGDSGRFREIQGDSGRFRDGHSVQSPKKLRLT
jgi:hypothetical protein